MNIYYQWIEWAYSHQVAEFVWNRLWLKKFMSKWVFSFKDIFEKIKNWWIWIIPIENSYAWSVHQNLYLMKDYDVKIIYENFFPINHCLCSKENNVSNIKKVLSHPQWLMQCENFLKKHNIEPINFSDTALSAKYVKESNEKWIWAICSEYASKIYNLNIIYKNINDQKGNTTRFLIITSKTNNIKGLKYTKQSLIFKVKDQPAILFKCLWAFATRFINLTKIESIPSKDKKFEYMFWIDLILPNDDKLIKSAIEELRFFTTEIKDLWKYSLLDVS